MKSYLEPKVHSSNIFSSPGALYRQENQLNLPQTNSQNFLHSPIEEIHNIEDDPEPPKLPKSNWILAAYSAASGLHLLSPWSKSIQTIAERTTQGVNILDNLILAGQNFGLWGKSQTSNSFAGLGQAMMALVLPWVPIENANLAYGLPNFLNSTEIAVGDRIDRKAGHFSKLSKGIVELFKMIKEACQAGLSKDRLFFAKNERGHSSALAACIMGAATLGALSSNKVITTIFSALKLIGVSIYNYAMIFKHKDSENKVAGLSSTLLNVLDLAKRIVPEEHYQKLEAIEMAALNLANYTLRQVGAKQINGKATIYQA